MCARSRNTYVHMTVSILPAETRVIRQSRADKRQERVNA